MRKIAENYKLPYYTMSPTYSVCKTHGYLTGEHYTCPHCGETTEVYSRITGYYRPVQNWNDGKSQEFKDRLVYNIETSVLKHEVDAVKAEQTVTQAVAEGRVMLFATKTCPKCKIAASLLDAAGIAYEKLFVEENEELARKYGLRQAPTLVVESADGASKFVELAGVKEYISAAVKA